RLMASSTIGSASLAATMRTDSPAARMPIPLPCRPDWLRTNERAASIRSSTDFGGLKYEGQRGSGYFSPAVAPARAVALAPFVPFSARLQAAATTAIDRNTTARRSRAFGRFIAVLPL